MPVSESDGSGVLDLIGEFPEWIMRAVCWQLPSVDEKRLANNRGDMDMMKWMVKIQQAWA